MTKKSLIKFPTFKDRSNNIETDNAFMLYPDTDALYKSNINQVIKELFDTKKRAMISDIKEDEKKLITSLNVSGEIWDLEINKIVVENFLDLGLSINRKSRKEILSAIGSQEKKKFSGLRGVFNKNG